MDIMRSQSNMTWIDMPHHHITHLKLFWHFFLGSWIVNFSQHLRQKYMPRFNINNIIILGFKNIYFEDIQHHHIVSCIIFIHDKSMYIHITYINTHIYQGLNLRLHGNTPRFAPPNHFKSLIRWKKSLILLSSTWNYFKNSKFIQML